METPVPALGLKTAQPLSPSCPGGPYRFLASQNGGSGDDDGGWRSCCEGAGDGWPKLGSPATNRDALKVTRLGKRFPSLRNLEAALSCPLDLGASVQQESANAGSMTIPGRPAATGERIAMCIPVQVQVQLVQTQVFPPP